MVKHRGEHTAHGAFLAPHLAAVGFLVPEVTTIRSRDGAGVFGGIAPGRFPLETAGFVHDPLPRNHALLAGLLKQAVDALHVRAPHRGNKAGSEQLVADAAASDGPRGFSRGVHGLNQIKRFPNWCNDPTGGRKPINAKCETVRDLPSFRDAYRTRRCIVPVDGFFEWKAIKGQRAKQPYAIAMKDGSPFGLAGTWENWKEPTSGEWIRTFAIITTDSNELVADIHDRMPVILAPVDFARWLGEEPDPRDLMRPFPAEPMRMWPISTRVNKPENDDASIVEPVERATDAA